MVCVQEYIPFCSLSSQNECRMCPIAVWERQSLVGVRAMLVAVGLETGETQLCLSCEWGVVLFLAFSVKLGRVWIACFSFGAVVGFEASKVYWGRCFCGIRAFAISLLSGCVPSHFSGDQLFQTNSTKRKEHFPSVNMQCRKYKCGYSVYSYRPCLK